MNKMKSQAKSIFLLKAVALLIAMVLVFAQIGVHNAAAEDANEAPDYSFAPTDMGISNKQFTDGDGLASPNGWTGSSLVKDSTASIISGSIDLDANNFNKNKKKYKIVGFDDENNGDSPSTPFGTNDYPNTSKNALLINTVSATTSFGYSSSELTIAKNKFYTISAYVKTGAFTTDNSSGAAIKITGTDFTEQVAFTNIDTSAKTSNMGWEKYTFFIEGSSFKDIKATLSLQVGDYYEDKDGVAHEKSAKGYALFDTINATEIRYNDYADAVNSIDDSKTTKAHSFKKTNELSAADYNGDFENESVKWTDYTGSNTSHDIISSTTIGRLGLEFMPYAPTEKSNILAIYSNKNAAGYGFYKSEPITITQHKFYKLSVWAKTLDVTGGTGAFAAITGDYATSGVATDKKPNVSATVTGDDTDKSRFGWKEQAFYIKGSSLQDYAVNVELGLGTKESMSSGTALFDDVTLETLSAVEFSANSANGTLVDFDGTLPETGVSNGFFNLAGQYDEYKYPLVAQDWTSLIEKNNANAKNGIVSLNGEHYKKHSADNAYFGAVNPTSNSEGTQNAMLIVNKTATYNAIKSPTISLAASETKKISVSMKVSATEGYGATLILYNGTSQISSIEKIGETNGFETFTFYIQGSTAANELSLEISLGKNKKEDYTKGYIFVESVKFEALAAASGTTPAEDFATIASNYYNVNFANENTKIATYTFIDEHFTGFDRYSEKFFKAPYNWTATLKNSEAVTYGIFDTKVDKADHLPSYFKHMDDTSRYVMMLRNNSATYSKLSSAQKFTLANDSYYKITVSMKMDSTFVNSDTAIGANIILNGTEFAFNNIKSTDTIIDETKITEEYKTFTFYISSGSNGKDVNIDISLGGDKLSNQASSGAVYVNYIKLETINNAAFDESVKALDDDDTTDYDIYNIKAVLGTTTPDDTTPDTTTGGVQWWLIPSILFAVALILALIAVVIRKASERRTVKAPIEKINSYDRVQTLNKIHNEKADTIDQTVASTAPDQYAQFDDITEVPTNEIIVESKDVEIVTSTQTTPAAPVAKPKKAMDSLETFDKFED